MSAEDHLWVIALAAGDGRRVSAWTTDADGGTVPKQYWPLHEGETMLRWALRRASDVVPPERIVVVVAEGHRRFWEPELRHLSAENVVVQPRDRGTAAGVLLPFLRIFQHRDPQARLLLLPCDHYVADEATLRGAVATAAQKLGRGRDGVVLLGMQPHGFDPEYGWILPAPGPENAVRRVSGFVEKPDAETARELIALGALVNSFIVLAEARALLGLYEEALPEPLRCFLACLGRGTGGVAELYDSIPAADLSRDVLERAASLLRVLAVPDCGWNDLGTPARLQSFLDRVGSPHGSPPSPRPEPAKQAFA